MLIDIIHHTDALSGLKLLDSGSVDCIVTSPPYWQLRDYGLAPILFGGNEECSHDFDKLNICKKCGGWLGQLGQEPGREMYIAHLLEIFDECRRVLSETGSLWVNLGDSYNNSGKGKSGRSSTGLKMDSVPCRILPKSLCNIPGRFAEEMILRGWILRNEIIWHKSSVIPSSARDRFTVDFEKMFFFTRSPEYYFDRQYEPYAPSTFGRYKRGFNVEGVKNSVYRGQYGAPAGLKQINPKGRNKRTVWRLSTANSKHAHFASFPAGLIESPILAGSPPGGVVLDPFMGSGTTAIEAVRLGRHYIGIEANPEYVSICNERLTAGKNKLNNAI